MAQRWWDAKDTQMEVELSGTAKVNTGGSTGCRSQSAARLDGPSLGEEAQVHTLVFNFPKIKLKGLLLLASSQAEHSLLPR